MRCQTRGAMQMNDAPLFTKVELFPDISVGDAPLTGAAAGAKK
jgi:hypothetical protein